MTMLTEAQFAVLAASVYRTTRDPENRISPPQGWNPITDAGLDVRLAAMGFTGTESHAFSDSGFEAAAYKKGSEIVIAFAGWAPLTSVVGDVITSAGLGLGVYTNQLRDAARFYVAVKEAMPAGTTFAFIGHSLGGGLAALMAVYFDKPAVVFDQAPFKEAALANHRSRIAADLASAGLAPDADLAGYYVGENTLSGTLVRGELAVRSIAVEGDILTVGFPDSLRLGPPVEKIELDDAVVAASSGIDLHSIDLLALLRAAPSLAGRIAAIPMLLPSLYDEHYFANDLRNPDRDILTHFLRHEFGVPGQLYSAGDGMFTSFVNELAVLTEPGVMQQTVLDTEAQPQKNFQHAMLLVLQQHYYEIRVAFDPSKTLFKSTTGGWYMDTGVVKVGDLVGGRLLIETIGFMYDGGSTVLVEYFPDSQVFRRDAV